MNINTCVYVYTQQQKMKLVTIEIKWFSSSICEKKSYMTANN